MAKTILLIEDDPNFRAFVRETLVKSDFRVLEAESSEIGLHLVSKEQPDLVILDIHLPGEGGIEICKNIRSNQKHYATPIIMLTADCEMETKSAGFEAGADQYLLKTFEPKELVLWVQALLRRLDFSKEKEENVLARDLVIDLKSHLVRFKDQVISNLTGKEFDLFYFLVKKRPHVITRKQILSQLWHTIAIDRLVDTHISNLRKKIPQELSDKIQAVPGKGFRFFE